MIVYHGTNNDFDRFDLSFSGLNTDGNATDENYAETARLGFWFTDNRSKAADVYEKVMECEVKFENPLHVENLEALANWIACTGMTAAELRDQTIEQGYDSIIIDNDEEFEGVSYIAFSPDQITIL